MTYDAASGAVIYRSRLHATLKRNFQAMPGVEWLELLCKHIPDRSEHMVRYYGRYSSRTRGAERERPEPDELDAETASPARQAAKAAWAKLIRKVYEVDPLECPRCGAQMRVIALIEDPPVIERILSWLGLWEPLQPGRAVTARTTRATALLPPRPRHRLSTAPCGARRPRCC